MAEPSLVKSGRYETMMRRSGPLAIIAALVSLAALATLVAHPRPFLIWNVSASSPVGLYAMEPSFSRLRPGDMVVAWAPPAARRMADDRHYVPFAVPLVKQVSAAAGDRVCARGATILVNNRPIASRRRHDRSGRPMTWWTGCHRLRLGEAFLLSSTGPIAFDGRYFGITKRREIIGKARLLWAG